MKNNFFLIVLLNFLFLLFTASNTLAETYFVAQMSAGDGSGKSYSNRMSVEYHNSYQFSPGDVIYVCGEITSVIQTPSSGEPGNYIYYRGDHPQYPSDINWSGNSQFRFTGSSYLIIQGLTMRNGVIALSTSGDSAHVVIRNCNIFNMSQKGIFIVQRDGRARPTYITIGGADNQGNKIYNVGTDTGGMDISLSRTDNWVISYNQLYGSGTERGIDGITTHQSSHGLIEYNQIYSHNKIPPDNKGEDGIDLKENTNNVIIRYNHIFNHTYQSGITVQMGSREINIYGNAIHGNRWAGILIKRGNYLQATDMHGISVFANLIYNNGAGVMVQSSGTADIKISGVNVYNNTIVNNGGTIGYQGGGVNLSEGSGHVVKNNILYANDSATTVTSPRQQLYLRDINSATVDANQYYFPGVTGETLIRVGSQEYTLSQFKALGQEPNGAEGDPLFIDEKNNNFRLSNNSPSIGTGIKLNNYINRALNPEKADFDKSLFSIIAIETSGYDRLDRGAFLYKVQSSVGTPIAPSNLKVLSH